MIFVLSRESLRNYCLYEGKKEKKEKENVKVKTCRRIHHYPNGHVIAFYFKKSCQARVKSYLYVTCEYYYFLY